MLRNGGDDLEGGRRDVDVGNEDTGVVVIGGELLHEVAHVLHANGAVANELHKDAANVWSGGVRILGGDWVGVAFAHFFGGDS